MWRCDELSKEKKKSKKGAQISNRQALGREGARDHRFFDFLVSNCTVLEDPHPTVRILSRTSGELVSLLSQADGNQLPDRTVIRTPLLSSHYDVPFGGLHPIPTSS